MNATHATTTPASARAPVDARSRPMDSRPHDRYRSRDFGIGYGNSSGYAADRRYTSDWARPIFRCR